MSVIKPYLHGWDKIEPSLIAAVATNQNVLLLGKHGIGKSMLMRMLGAALSEGKPDFNTIKYNMPSESFMSMLGIPSTDALKEGRMEITPHDRSLLVADVALFDEITRASSENQNYLLEILQEGTCFGKKLDRLKLIVATANDETYKGAQKLDAALLDRFEVVLPIPDTGTETSRFGAEELEIMIRLNRGGREENMENANKDLVDTINKIKKVNEELWTQQDKDKQCSVANSVIEFTARFFATLLTNLTQKNKGTKKSNYISIRQIAAQFPRVLMANAAYYKVVKNHPDYLKEGAMEAIKYSLATKLCLEIGDLMTIYSGLEDLLTDGDALVGRVKIGITNGTVAAKMEMFRKYVQVIKDNLELDEITNAIGTMLQELQIVTEDKETGNRVDKDEVEENIRTLIELHDFLDHNNIEKTCLGSIKMSMWMYAIDGGNIDDKGQTVISKALPWYA